MRKLLILAICAVAFIPMLSKKTDYIDVTNVIFVNSVAIDYNEESEQYVFYFYVLNNFNLAKAELSSSNIDTLAYVAKIESKSFAEASNEIRKMANVFIHYHHLKTVILTKNFFSKERVWDFYTFIKDHIEIYPTFYVFATDSKIEDIYNIENLSEISAYHTILLNPDIIKTYKLITYIDLVKSILLDNYTLKIPHISSVEDVFSKQGESYLALTIDGYSIFHEQELKQTYLYEKLPLLKWMLELYNVTYTVDELNLYIKEGNYVIKQKGNQCVITYHISGTHIHNYKDIPLDEAKELAIDKMLTELKQFKSFMDAANIDIFNINYQFHQTGDYYKNVETRFEVRLDSN